ncbi:MAG TPA: hypothetical protein VM580_32500 [Labilithrix sp.]|jgi:hypothetical protein|nr:hypothetical protein [Labilithrix sp.]
MSADIIRKTCREIMKSLVPAERWAANEAFASELKEMIASHRVATHKAWSLLDAGKMDINVMRRAHLEFRHAFAQNFSEWLLNLMVSARDLEPTQGALGKSTARCLIVLNVLDELGFEGESADPRKGHYVAFDKVLRELGLSEEEVNNHVPFDSTKAARRVVESAYGDHAALAVTVAVGESLFTRIAGPWARNMSKNSNIDTTTGYHAIHVEHDGHFLDDDHADDVWFVFCQAVEPARYDEMRGKVAEVLESWAKMADSFVAD